MTQPNLYAELVQPCLRRRRQALGKRAEDARGHVDQDDSCRGGIDASKLRSERAAHENRQRPGHLDARRPGAHQHEGQQIAVAFRILFGLRLLEGSQNVISNRHRVGQALEPGREAREFVVAEIAMARPGRKDQTVVLESDAFSIERVDEHASPITVDAGHLAQDHRGVPLISQDAANR